MTAINLTDVYTKDLLREVLRRCTHTNPGVLRGSKNLHFKPMVGHEKPEILLLSTRLFKSLKETEDDCN